ncbi:MAG: SgcJ/EcaC family oxidoreductase [Acidobacteria bacterium]|nr:SgcJ/EcaC family oxidoreductase [Acidobacteriota bacterium]
MLAVLLLISLAASPEQAIRQVLDDQVKAWNAGDIPAFMSGYEESEATAFVGATVVKGHRRVLARYLEKYPSRPQMGTLTFSEVEVRLLGGDHAAVIGRFHLARSAEGGGPATGLFTLVFRKTTAGWKIILDHTS